MSARFGARTIADLLASKMSDESRDMKVASKQPIQAVHTMPVRSYRVQKRPTSPDLMYIGGVLPSMWLARTNL